MAAPLVLRPVAAEPAAGTSARVRRAMMAAVPAGSATLALGSLLFHCEVRSCEHREALRAGIVGAALSPLPLAYRWSLTSRLLRARFQRATPRQELGSPERNGGRPRSARPSGCSSSRRRSTSGPLV